MTDSLREQWQQLASRYTNDSALVNDLFDELEEAYSAPGRHYHNQHHINAMLKGASKRNASDDLLFAIWYHDIVYNSLKHDNEEKSAEEAGEILKKLNYPLQGIEKVKHMILRTKEHMKMMDDDAETCLLLDLDLAILGAGHERYKEYMRQVRSEYAWVPGFMYRKGRKKVLQQFLDAEHIYRLDEFRSKLEANARNNMRSELQELSR